VEAAFLKSHPVPHECRAASPRTTDLRPQTKSHGSGFVLPDSGRLGVSVIRNECNGRCRKRTVSWSFRFWSEDQELTTYCSWLLGFSSFGTVQPILAWLGPMLHQNLLLAATTVLRPSSLPKKEASTDQHCEKLLKIPRRLQNQA
jgi:hypothetical protein